MEFRVGDIVLFNGSFEEPDHPNHKYRGGVYRDSPAEVVALVNTKYGLTGVHIPEARYCEEVRTDDLELLGRDIFTRYRFYFYRYCDKQLRKLRGWVIK